MKVRKMRLKNMKVRKMARVGGKLLFTIFEKDENGKY